MPAIERLKTSVPPTTKVRFHALARARGLTDSKLLGLLIETVLEQNPQTTTTGEGRRPRREPGAEALKHTLRLRRHDAAALALRAEKRGLKPATYLTTLVRAHLNDNPPLPVHELAAIKRTIAELNAIGRNLNQLVRLAHTGATVSAPLRQEIARLLPAVQMAREKIKDQLIANAQSWEAAYD